MFSDPDKNLAQLGLGEGMKVADLGAGTGFYSIAAGRRVGGSGRVYAIDVQGDLLQRLKTTAAAEKVHNIEVIRGSIDSIGGTKLREAIADRAVLANTFFQIGEKDRDALALEAKRIVRPGGKLLVVDWSPGSPLSPRSAVPRAAAEAAFGRNGFALDKAFPAGDHHYGLVFSRN